MAINLQILWQRLFEGKLLFIANLVPVFIYNVTINIADQAHKEWLKWMKETHIDDVMKTGCFVDSKICKLLYVEDEGHTYSIQYRFLEMNDIERYQKEFAPKLQAQHSDRFKNQYAAFRTILEEV